MADRVLLEDASLVLLEDGFALLTEGTYPAAVVADGPVAYYRLGESSAVFVDAMGGDSAASAGSATLDAAGALADDDGAVALDGTSAYVTVPDRTSLNFGDGPVSVEWWHKRTTNSGRESKIFDKTGSGALQITENGSGVVTLGKGGTAAIVGSTTAETLGSWHHYVVTKNGAACTIYLDGQDVTGTITNLTLTNSAGQWVIGANRSTGADYFPATIDEVAFYNYVLTSTQVATHYAAAGAIAKTASDTGTGSEVSTRGATVVHVASTIAEQTTPATIALAVPSGLVSGDVLTAFIVSSSASITNPSGWSSLRADVTNSAGETLRSVYRVVSNASAEPASYTWGGLATRTTAVMSAWRNVDNTTVQDVASTSGTANLNTLTVSGVTTVTAGAALVTPAFIDAASAADVVIPSGYTDIAHSTGTGRRAAVAWLSQAAAGATGSITWTHTGATLAFGAVLLALRPGAAITSNNASVTATDSGAATDVSTLDMGPISNTGAPESGAGNESTTETATMGVDETGALTDTATTIDRATTDAATGTDTSGTISRATTESAAASDVSSPALGSSDTGASSDASSALAAASADTGAASELSGSADRTSGGELAAGTESQALPTKGVAEAGTGADTSSLDRATSDTAAASDASTAGAAMATSDPGTGAELSSTTRALTDAAAGTDVSGLSPIDVFVADAGAGSDTSSTTKDSGDASLSSTQTGASTDAPGQLVAALTATESGSAAETATMVPAIALSDTGAGTDAGTTGAAPVVADSATGTDAISAMGLGGLDAAAGLEATSGADRAAGELGAASDIGTPALEQLDLTASDAGTSSDVALVLVAWLAGDSATGADAIAGDAQIAFYGDELAVMDELATPAAALTTTDAGFGADFGTSLPPYIFLRLGLHGQVARRPRRRPLFHGKGVSEVRE